MEAPEPADKRSDPRQKYIVPWIRIRHNTDFNAGFSECFKFEIVSTSEVMIQSIKICGLDRFDFKQ